MWHTVSFLVVALALHGAVALSAAPDPAATTSAPAADRLTAVLDEPSVAQVARRRLYAACQGLQSEGWMDVRTWTDPAGGFRWIVLGEGGSTPIRKRGLKAVLDAEARSLGPGQSRVAAFTSDNYTFALESSTDGLVHVRLAPRRRDSALIEGIAYLSPGGDLMRLEGRLAKSPSFWVRGVTFIRQYARIAGRTLPVAVESVADVKMAGLSRFVMTYDYESVGGRPVVQPMIARADFGSTPSRQILVLHRSRSDD